MDIGLTAKELTSSDDCITVWNAEALYKYRNHPHYRRLEEVIDTMGMMSKSAQGINLPLTSVQRLRDNPTHLLYLLCSGTRCLGVLKSGVKKLFIRTANAQLIEMDPMCVLDFYVCTSEQRAGHGRALYDYMLSYQGVQPAELGIDRPSPKFLAFMKKHFGLSDYVPQTNNFVVFNQYFEIAKPMGRNRMGISRNNNLAPAPARCPVPKMAAPTPTPLTTTSLPAKMAVVDAEPPTKMMPLQPYQLKGVVPCGAIGSVGTRPGDGPPRGGATGFNSIHQQRPSVTSQGSASLATSTNSLSSQLGSMSINRRTTSPTRSSATYNILSHPSDDSAATGRRGRGRM